MQPLEPMTILPLQEHAPVLGAVHLQMESILQQPAVFIQSGRPWEAESRVAD